MDLLVVAAAAGAVYVAKYWQQFTSKEDSSESASGDLVYGQSNSRKLLHQFKDHALPLPRLGQNQPGREAVWDRSGFGDCETGLASTSGALLDGNVLSLMNFSTGVFGRENFQEIVHCEKGKSDFPTGEMGSIRIRKRKIRKKSIGCIVKPMNSLESCLIAHLNKEDSRKEQYVYSSVSSTVRPLLVTNGRQIISRASSEEKETGSRMGSIGLPRRRSKVSRSSRLSISRASERPHHSQGSLNGMLLFFLGIIIGIMSTIVANQREMERLGELLKESENLVQDLHEELEMGEFSTVKELNCVDFESSTVDKHLNEHNQEPDKAELMNRIEEELEAELEKLELSMESSRLERISKLVEVDPGIEADIVQGEVEIDNVNKQPDQDANETCTTDTHAANYAVPAMELSLRLHELIKSRLEARILELEAALETSNQRRDSMESDNTVSCRMLYSESETLSLQESPTDQPMVMNLSGEALYAYNEAYDEIYESDHIVNAEKQTVHGIERSVSEYGNVGERWSRSLLLDKLRDAEGTPRSWGSNGLMESEEEDEMEKLLIRQIVERTRQGFLLI